VKTWFNPPPSLDVLLKTLQEKRVAYESKTQQLPLYIERAQPKGDGPDCMWDTPRRSLFYFHGRLARVSLCRDYAYFQSLTLPLDGARNQSVYLAAIGRLNRSLIKWFLQKS
jgi:hypothetical protein